MHPSFMNDLAEYEKIFNPWGAYVLEIDAGTHSGCDVRFVRLKLEVCDRKLIPTKHLIPYRNPAGKRSVFDIEIEIESEKSESLHAWAGRKEGRPYPSGTEFGTNPTVTQPPPPTGNNTQHTGGGVGRNGNNLPLRQTSLHYAGDEEPNPTLITTLINTFSAEMAEWENQLQQVRQGQPSTSVTQQDPPVLNVSDTTPSLLKGKDPMISVTDSLVLTTEPIFPAPTSPIQGFATASPSPLKITFDDSDGEPISEKVKRLKLLKSTTLDQSGIKSGQTSTPAQASNSGQRDPARFAKPTPKRPYTWGPQKKKAKSVTVSVKKKVQIGTGSSKKHQSGASYCLTSKKADMGTRLRSSKSKDGPGSTPEIYLPDAELPTPVVTEPDTRSGKKKDPRRSLRVQAQADPDSTLTKAQKRKKGEGSSTAPGVMTKKIKTAVGDWLPVIEDAIPLNQIAPMELVLYQPPEEADGFHPAGV